MFSGRSCPGGALTFFCLPNRNVSKDNEVSAQANFREVKVKRSGRSQKGTPLTGRPDGRLPCVARHAGRWIRTRAIRCAATRSNMNSPTAPGAAALLGGSQGPQQRRSASESGFLI